MLALSVLAAAAFVAHVPTAAEKKVIIAAVGDKLLDGPSARYRWPKMLADVGYCGWVNAKNSYGAYTGFKPFFVTGALTKGGSYEVYDVNVSTSDPSSYNRGIAETMCSGQGYDVSGPPPEAP